MVDCLTAEVGADWRSNEASHFTVIGATWAREMLTSKALRRRLVSAGGLKSPGISIGGDWYGNKSGSGAKDNNQVAHIVDLGKILCSDTFWIADAPPNILSLVKEDRRNFAPP
ncbi:hypothetical protein V6N13_046335 [Hibiscus sabdariffa]